MKKRFLIATIFVLVLFFTSVSFAFQGSQSSGEKTADAAVSATDVYMTAVTIITDGTNDAKLILYDNASAASGTVLLEMTIAGGDNYGGRVWTYPLKCWNGIYGDIAGTGASYIVEYIK